MAGPCGVWRMDWSAARPAALNSAGSAEKRGARIDSVMDHAAARHVRGTRQAEARPRASSGRDILVKTARLVCSLLLSCQGTPAPPGDSTAIRAAGLAQGEEQDEHSV